MKTIEFNDVTVLVPESWADITVGQYESFYQYEATNENQSIELIAMVCNTTAGQLRELPKVVFEKEVLPAISFVFAKNEQLPVSAAIEIDGAPWVIMIEDALSLGEWIDAENAQKSATPVCGTLAIVCRPVGEKYDPLKTEEREKLFADMTVAQVKPLLGFFLACNDVLEKRISAFGNLAAIAETLPNTIKDFARLTGGIKLSRIWPTIRYIYLIKSLQRQLRKFSPS